MTVMPGSGEVADKAVSTEDALSNVKVARLEAVFAALVETKVESMKASASATGTATTTTTTTTTTTRRAGSAPASPRRPRLTSSSTASSSQNHNSYNHHRHHHHHHHHHHRHHQEHEHQQRSGNNNKYDKKKKEDRRHRRHDSAPCGEFLEELGIDEKNKNGKGRRRDSEHPIKSPKKKRRHSRSPQSGPGAQPGLQILQNVIESSGQDPELCVFRMDRDQQRQNFDLLNFERAREAFGDPNEFPNRLQQTSCCYSQSATQLKIHYDVDDYVTLKLDDDDEDEDENDVDDENDNRNDNGNNKKKRRGTCDKYRRPKRRKKRRRRRIGPEGTPDELADPEELPPRARWTIVATACLLLAMSLLLVGVTLRMAPIIDDMVRKENEELLNSLNQDSFVPVNNATNIP